MTVNIRLVFLLPLVVWFCAVVAEVEIAEECDDPKQELYKGGTYTYCCKNCVKVWQGDMVIDGNLNTEPCCKEGEEGYEEVVKTRRRLNPSIVTQFGLWKNGSVPYEIDANMPSGHIERIKKAVNEYNTKTVIKLIPRTIEPHYVYYTYVGDAGSSTSPVGQQSGKQEIRLASGCTEGCVKHETGHSLGWSHTQMREDRDFYIKVLWQNIDKTNHGSFSQNTATRDDCLRYDYRSIMHYMDFFFAKSGTKSIEAINPPGSTIGRGELLTKMDIECMNGLYSQCYVSLFEDDHFKGTKYTPLGLGDHAFKALEDSDDYIKPFADDQIESLQIVAAADTHCSITLAEHGDFSGWNAVIKVDNTESNYRKTFDFNLDAIKAMAPAFKPNEMSALKVNYRSSCRVTFWTEINYQGTQMGPYDTGEYTLNQLTALKFVPQTIRSLKLEPFWEEDCTLQLFKNADFTQLLKEYTARGTSKDREGGSWEPEWPLSLPDINIDPISSIKLTAKTQHKYTQIIPLSASTCNAYLETKEMGITKGLKLGTLEVAENVEIEFDIRITSACTGTGTEKKKLFCNILTIGNGYEERYPQIHVTGSQWVVVLNANKDSVWGAYYYNSKPPPFASDDWFHFYLRLHNDELYININGFEMVKKEDFTRYYVGKKADIIIAGSEYEPLLNAQLKNICIRTLPPTLPSSYHKIPVAPSTCNAFLKAEQMQLQSGYKLGTLSNAKYLEIEFDLYLKQQCVPDDSTTGAPSKSCNVLQIGKVIDNADRKPQISLHSYGGGSIFTIGLNTDNEPNEYGHFLYNAADQTVVGEWTHFYLSVDDTTVRWKYDGKENVKTGDWKRTKYIGTDSEIYLANANYRPQLGALDAIINNLCIRTSDTQLYLPPSPSTKIPLSASTCNAYLGNKEITINKGLKLGTLKVEEYLEIEFDIRMKSMCPGTGTNRKTSQCNILTIGNNYYDRYPQIHVTGSKWVVALKADKDSDWWGTYYDVTKTPPFVSDDAWIHFYLRIKNDELYVNINGVETVWKEDFTRSYLQKEVPIIVAEPSYEPLLVAELKNICIRTSNSGAYFASHNFVDNEMPTPIEPDIEGPQTKVIKPNEMPAPIEPDIKVVKPKGDGFYMMTVISSLIAVIVPLLIVFVICGTLVWCLMNKKEEYAKVMDDEDSYEVDGENIKV